MTSSKSKKFIIVEPFETFKFSKISSVPVKNADDELEFLKRFFVLFKRTFAYLYI